MTDFTKTIAARYAGAGRYFRSVYNPEGLAAIADHRKRFPLSKTAVYTHYLPHGLQRYLLVGDRFTNYLTGRIIDVGSRENVIKQALNITAELVDKNSPNLPSFDWEQELLPYADGSFDTVVCLDTLEHINDFHRSFADLVRVSKKYVIISIPNCWRKTFKQMLRGHSNQGAYGLPPERPYDRHKWFFNTEEMEDFFFYNTAHYPYRVAAVANHVPSARFWHSLLYPLVRVLLPERYSKNLLVNTSFFVLEKTHTHAKAQDTK